MEKNINITNQQRQTGSNGISLIKRFESLRLEAYRCPAGLWTIGYGHTDGVQPGDRINEQNAEQWLMADLQTAEALVDRECPGISQNQFDALVSFTFNVGTGNFLKSTLLKCVKANPANPNIQGELARWNRGGGVILAGLIRRRRAEAELYFS